MPTQVHKSSPISFVFEEEARKKGYARIAGVDEVGRGPLAGPVVAAACILPSEISLEGLDDSKKLTPAHREALFEHLTAHPEVVYGIGEVDAQQIDVINILQASLLAMLLAVQKLSQKPDYLLIDGIHAPKTQIPSKTLVKGDSRSFSIAAASVIAKVIRDRLMLEYHALYPQYGFDSHKGYGTHQHLLALEAEGPCPIHRLSFAPLKPLDQFELPLK